jgi:hypothetical protein
VIFTITIGSPLVARALAMGEHGKGLAEETRQVRAGKSLADGRLRPGARGMPVEVTPGRKRRLSDGSGWWLVVGGYTT